ncbi:MAG: hypothetical protein KatS3mg032_1454 [Cyclobacteriaceae bacterium]|nr:MAG: hypothetical protein KatS3mg032_1454 [Cyclobacteriaceae bacterium]
MIDIKYNWLFPWPYRLVTVCVPVYGIFVRPDSLLIILALGIFCALALTAHEGTEINTITRTYREYTSFLFFKTGKFTAYNAIEKIFINTSRESEKMYTAHTLHAAVFSSVYYNAWLKMDDGQKILLKKSKDKQKLKEVLTPLCQAADLKVVDDTGQKN